MLGVLLFLLILWIVLGGIGLLVHGLIWLFWIALVLFVVTGIYRLVAGGKGSKSGDSSSAGSNE